MIGALALAIAVFPLPATAAPPPAVSRPHATVTPGGAWSWQNPKPSGDALYAISCPTTTTCFAAGNSGPILVTTDGGATWTQQLSSSGVLGISCPSVTVCVAVDRNGNALITTDGGASWPAQNLNATGFLSGVSCPSTTYCVAVGAAGSIFTTSGGLTSWTRQQSSTAQDLYGVSCVSAASCYAAGVGGIFSSSASWNAVYTGQATFYAISCNSACLAVGQAGNWVYMSINGWQAGGTGSTVNLYGVSCAGQTCYAAGSDGNVYVMQLGKFFIDEVAYGHASIGELGALYSVSCPSTTVCFVAGDHSFVSSTTNGGTGWTVPSVSGPQSVGLRAVTCSSATNCIAVGDSAGVAWSTTGGASWTYTTKYPPPSANYLAVSCPSDTMCVIVGQGGMILKSAGVSSPPTPVTSTTPDALTAVACPTTSSCLALTQTGYLVTSSNGGTTWSTPNLIDASAQLTGLSCPTATACFAADNAGRILATADGGAHWTVSFDVAKDPNAGAPGQFDAISCPNATTCYAVGPQGLAATTLDGITWRTDNTPTSAELDSVSCPTANVCFAASPNVDATMLTTSDAGGTWTAQFPGIANWVTGVTCTSTTSCIAVGGSITRTVTGGAAWVKDHPAGSVTGLHHIACTDASNCYVTAFDEENPGGVEVTHDGGVTWTTRSLSNSDQVNGVTCPASNNCFAVGWPGAIYHSTDGFATATYQPNPLSGADQSLSGITCTSTTTCYIVGTTGNALATINGGASWQLESTGTTANLWSVSCPTTSVCVAVGDNGTTLARSGGAWRPHASGTTKTLGSVSCSSATTCYAVGNTGTVLVTTNQGVTWSAQTSGVTIDLLDVQCLQASACLAVGVRGTLIYTLDGTTWAPDLLPTREALGGVAFLSPGLAFVVGLGGSILQNPNEFFLCLTSSISSDLASPQAVGTTITITASTVGCNHLFEFWLLPPGGTWAIVQPYSATSTYTWNTTTRQPGTYTFGVWARDAGSPGIGGSPPNTYDSFTSMQFTLNPVACGGASISAAPPSPATPGTQVTLTGAATGCPNPRYEFWALWQGASSWQLLSGYSTSPAYTWNSTGALNGIEHFGVWVRDASSSAAYDTFAGMPYSIAGPTCASVTASANPTTTVHGTGAHVIITGVASGCTNPVYEFWMLAAGSSTWQLIQGYSTTATYDWNTSGAPAGTEHFGVWVRDAASSAGYDSYVSLPFALT